MYLTHSVAIVIPCPLPTPGGVAHRGMAAAEFRKVVITAPFIGVYHCPWVGRVDHEGLQGLLVRIVHDLEPQLPGLSAYDPDHRRTVILHRPMSLGLVGSTPG